MRDTDTRTRTGRHRYDDMGLSDAELSAFDRAFYICRVASEGSAVPYAAFRAYLDAITDDLMRDREIEVAARWQGYVNRRLWDAVESENS